MSFSNESGTAFAPYKFSSIPLQRNYGTHVTGNLLTNSGELDIVVKPGFGEPDIPFDIYDGSSLVEPDMDGNNVNVNSAANMAYVLNNLSQFNDKVINMNCNIDFAGAEIKNSTSRISLSIQGNGHTIKNLTLMSNDIACGLIPNMASGTVSDLTIDNFRVVRDESKSDSYSGVIVGESHGNVVIKNCRVTNSEVMVLIRSVQSLDLLLTVLWKLRIVLLKILVSLVIHGTEVIVVVLLDLLVTV